jgi:hypothetical protein
MGASATQYKLAGGSKDELRRYVNSQVEITGKIENASSSSSGATGSTSTGSTAGGSATGSTAGGSASGSASRGSDSGPTLHVDSVRQVSPSCSAQ